MNVPLQILVYDQSRLVFSTECPGRVILGRQTEGEAPFSTRRLVESDRLPKKDWVGSWRVVIASLNEDTVSRFHAEVEPLDQSRVLLRNLSARARIRMAEGIEIPPQATRELAIPTALLLGQKVVRLQPPPDEGPQLQGLAEATMPPGAFTAQGGSRLSTRMPALALPSTSSEVDIDSLIHWLRVAMDVLQSAVSSSDFFQKAARALVDIVGLDAGAVLVLDSAGEWRTEAYETVIPAGSAAEGQWMPSRMVLSRVCHEKRTFWLAPEQATASEAMSLVGIKAVVAAPILNNQGVAIGALYGDRRQGNASMEGPAITKLEAMMVELIASGAAAGLARLEQEREAVAARVQFEQFFTPKLAHELTQNRNLLQGRDAEVSIVFCDIRGFSRFALRIGPEKTLDWICDVMGTLSDCVLDHGGVLVDYIGDELMAMWGAPQSQPDHARLAARAALAMLDRLPTLNERWLPVLGETMGVGIGINTGIARVGNTGSRQKFKYGPLGNTVNLASRLQGATKYMKVRLLVSGATFAQIGQGFNARRLAKVRVVNIHEPVELYELAPAGHPHWTSLQQNYEEALRHFEMQEFHMAAKVLGIHLTEFPDDSPSLVLMSRAVGAMVEEPEDFDPVWVLPGK